MVGFSTLLWRWVSLYNAFITVFFFAYLWLVYVHTLALRCLITSKIEFNSFGFLCVCVMHARRAAITRFGCMSAGDLRILLRIALRSLSFSFSWFVITKKRGSKKVRNRLDRNYLEVGGASILLNMTDPRAPRWLM